MKSGLKSIPFGAQMFPFRSNTWKQVIGTFVLLGVGVLAAMAETVDNFSRKEWRVLSVSQGEISNSPGALTLKDSPGKSEWVTAAKTFEINLDKEPVLTVSVKSLSGKGQIKLLRSNPEEKHSVITITKPGVYNYNIQEGLKWKGNTRITVYLYSLGDGSRITYEYLKFTDKPVAPAGENLIRDSSFEETQEYRPIYHQIGEYRLDGVPRGLSFSDREHWHGKRSLELAPGAEWVFETTDRYADKGIFSAGIKGVAGAMAEFEVSAVTFDVHGGKLNPELSSRKFKLSAEWQRMSLPFTNKRKEWSALYVVTVRNCSNSPMWLDAVQLELEKDQPSAFSPQHCSFWNIDRMVSYKLDPSSDAAAFAGRQGRNGEVKLTLIAPAGVSGRLRPVTGGVPFPKGELFDPDKVALYDADGKSVPCQTTVLARRNTDGSIVSLLLNFQAALKSGERRAYTLKYGVEPVSGGKLLAEVKGDRIVVATGAVTASISTKHFRLFDEIRGSNGRIVNAPTDAGLFIVTPIGQQFSTGETAPAFCRIETNGSQRAVIRVSGKHRAANGTELLDYDVRIHAFKGQSSFLIEYTIINRETPPDLGLRSAGLRLPVFSGDGKRSFGLVEAAALMVPGTTGRASLTQLRQRGGEAVYDVLLRLPDGSEKRLKHTRSDGSAVIGEAAVAVTDFWQLNPKELAAEPGCLSVYLWPADGVKDLSLPFGLASTLRIVYAPLEGGKDICELAGMPLLLQPDPAWMSASGVFGRFITAEQERKAFPRFAAIDDRTFDLIKRFRTVSDFDGMFDYGDFGSPAYCANHETEGVDNLWMRYLRTGDPEMYRLAVVNTLHSRDIDTCHIRPDTAARHTHSTGTHTCYHFHTGHFWQTGQLWHYLLTGDRRSFDDAVASAAELVTKSSIKYKPGRERSRILYHLAELYGLTGIVQFRQGFERQYNFGAGSNIAHSYYSGISLSALAKMYEVTGDKKYADALAADAAKCRTVADTCRDKKENITVGEGRDWHFFQAMGEAAERTGDPGYLAALTEYFLTPYSVASLPVDSSLSTTSAFFHALSRFGLKEPDDLPEDLFGINRLTGGMPSVSSANTFRFVIPGGKPFTLRIYKQLKFRFHTMFKYAQDRLPSVVYSLNGPDGKVVESGKFEGDQVECVMKLIEVKPKSRGDYRLELTFNNDCWGALSCSVPARLAADRWFFSRNSRFFPVAFWLRAPADGRLSVDYRWSYSDNGYAGQILGAALEDENGHIVARRVWTVPMNWRNDKDGKFCTQRLEMMVPVKYRGKPLRLLVNDIKWLEWKVVGLDYPWLSSGSAGVAP